MILQHLQPDRVYRYDTALSLGFDADELELARERGELQFMEVGGEVFFRGRWLLAWATRHIPDALAGVRIEQPPRRERHRFPPPRRGASPIENVRTDGEPLPPSGYRMAGLSERYR